MIKTINDLHETKYKLPQAVYDDVTKRIGDWLESGGSLNDSYIDNQFKYINEVLRRGNNE